MAQNTNSTPVKFVQLAEVPAANVPSNYMEWSVVSVASDAVSAGTSASVLVASGHSAVAGDWIVMLTGDEAQEAREVSSVTTDSITLASALSGSPSATETFAIMSPVDAPAQAEVVQVFIINDSDKDILVSLDGSTNNLIVVDGASVTLGLKSDNKHMERGGKIYLKHAGTQPTSGKVYLSRIY